MSDPKLPPIHTVRGQRVVLDSDLAALYGVLTKRLNEAVGRNADRFPDDFCFQLTREEAGNLRSQIATSSSERRGGRRFTPFAFTEHGALMAATVLRSPQALQMSRLRRAAKACLNHGQQVQNSVFECLLENDQWGKFRSGLLQLADLEHDSLRFYFLGNEWQRRVEHHGAKPTVDPEGPLLV